MPPTVPAQSLPGNLIFWPPKETAYCTLARWELEREPAEESCPPPWPKPFSNRMSAAVISSWTFAHGS